MLSDLRFQCNSLKAQVKALTQALRDVEAERDSLELEQAGQQESPSSVAASMLRTHSGSVSSMSESSGQHAVASRSGLPRVKSVVVSDYQVWAGLGVARVAALCGRSTMVLF